jgi:hypothetical protein
MLHYYATPLVKKTAVRVRIFAWKLPQYV